MSSHIETKHNQCYSIQARLLDPDSKISFVISDGKKFMSVALSKYDAFDLCLSIIKALVRLGD